MNVDIETLVRYPTESDDWLKTVGIGGVLLLFSFLLVPLFLVAGYGLRAIRAGMAGAETPPVFDDWGTLLTEGVVAMVISLVYQIIPIVLFVVLVGGSIAAMATGSRAGAGLGIVGLFGGMLLVWLLAIVFGYVGFAGVANYAKVGSIGAGFDFDVIRAVVTSLEYLLAWVYVVALNVVVFVVVGALSIIPFLGSIVGVFVSFYALPIAGWLWGQGFAEATGGTAGPGADPEATPA